MKERFRLASQCIEKQNLLAFGARVDASEIAEMIGVSRQHVTRLCRHGAVPGAYQSKGGHWRARWSGELVEWVRVNTTKLEQPFPTDELALLRLLDETLRRQAAVDRVAKAVRQESRRLERRTQQILVLGKARGLGL
jgi:hypothetical protein